MVSQHAIEATGDRINSDGASFDPLQWDVDL
jgi:hypothetical protein